MGKLNILVLTKFPKFLISQGHFYVHKNLLPIKNQTGQYGSIGVEIFKGGKQDKIDFGHFFLFKKKYFFISGLGHS